MSKEKLIELKKKLESKYVCYDGTGTFEEITQFEIEQKKNEQGTINNLDNYFMNLITNLSLNGKMSDECYDEFIVSFNDLKIALEQNGFDIGTIKSFEEIESIINDERIPVTFFPLQFSKTKKLSR